MSDEHDELRDRLRAIDPAASLPPADPERVARLLEDVMSTELTTENRETGTQNRGPLTWLVAAAAVVVLVVGGIIAVKAATGDNASPASVKPVPSQTVTTLSAPSDGATQARCMVPNAQALAQVPTAFDGTVSSIDGDTVTLTATKWYAGEPTDLVKVTAPGAQWERLLSAVHFTDGQRYLVSATDDGAVTVCGFSGAYSDELAGIYAEAFPGLMHGHLHGLLLAAGAGSRMGMPKALVHGDDGEPWLVRGVRVLTEGGCTQVSVVLGASAEQALPLLDGTAATAVIAADWADGMSASLRAGLAAAAGTDAEVAVVTLVDLPDVGADVVRRVAADVDPTTLRRASYDGRPGHPVVIGGDHWAAIRARVGGDRGARDYLGSHETELVECGDLATGHDVDRPLRHNAE